MSDDASRAAQLQATMELAVRMGSEFPEHFDRCYAEYQAAKNELAGLNESPTPVDCRKRERTEHEK